MQNSSPAKLKIDLKTKITLAALGIFLFLVLLEIGLRLGGFVILSLQEQRNRATIQQKGTYRIMCLGESTTVGYPSYLEKALNQRNIGIRFSVVHKGIGGTNTSCIVDSLESNLNAYQPDMVITMMGINDYGPHIPHEAVSGSRAIKFLKSFRVYKLTRLIWLHIVHKLKNEDIYGLDKAGSKINTTLKETPTVTEEKFSPAEESFKEAIALNPRNDRAYIDLGRFYLFKRRDKFLEAEGLFKEAIAINPKNDNAYVGLGCFYQLQWMFPESEESYKKAIALNPRNDEAYIGLAWLYGQQDRLPESEDLFKKAIALNPRNDRAYLGLGKFYLFKRRYNIPEAESSLKKAIELNPRNDEAYIGLGRLYLFKRRDKFLEAEDLFKKAIAINPKSEIAYIELGGFYRKQGKFLEAEELLKKAIALNTGNDWVKEWARRSLGSLYREMNKMELAEEYSKSASYAFIPITIDNYHKLKAILDKRRIRLVCVQYPMRSVEPLKKIFAGEQGIIFVDNKQIFEEAVRDGGFKEYFVDMFAGDLGHCTKKGNVLLAENIANTILKEVFGK